MDNISDFIPLIIIIGSVVYSIIKNTAKGNKEQEEMAKTTLPGKKEIPLPDDFWEEEEVITPEQTLIKEENRLDEGFSFPSHSIKMDTSKSRKNKKSAIERKLETEESSSDQGFLDIKDTDEIKKAIVYSEIFNRKDY